MTPMEELEKKDPMTAHKVKGQAHTVKKTSQDFVNRGIKNLGSQAAYGEDNAMKERRKMHPEEHRRIERETEGNGMKEHEQKHWKK